jgi:hypothetical protein
MKQFTTIQLATWRRTLRRTTAHPGRTVPLIGVVAANHGDCDGASGVPLPERTQRGRPSV